MPRRRLLVPGAVVLAALPACAGAERDTGSTDDVGSVATVQVPPSAAPTVTPTAAPATTDAPAPAPTTTLSPEARASELCSYETSNILGQIASAALNETSGLVASRRHRDVIWAHNDGNEMPGVFAVARDGVDLGFHPTEIGGVVDIEDIALLSGPEHDELLLADIGDNGSRRPSVRIYRFDEPDPNTVTPITDIEVLEFTYPDRPHNAEVLLLDEANRRIVIVTKEQRRVAGVPAELGPTEPSFVFEGTLESGASGPVELTAAGTLDAPLLETRTVTDSPNPVSLLGIGGLPTGGDVSADGALVALRTYETIWIWSRPVGRSVAESLAFEPCQARLAHETQGEAVGFFEGTVVTASEGPNPFLFQLRP
jgi:hypothetical protein